MSRKIPSIGGIVPIPLNSSWAGDCRSVDLILSAKKITGKFELIIFSSLLVFVGLIGSMTIDMYVPSLPYIGQLIYGPLTDSFGRRVVLLITVVIGLLGSILCFKSQTISILYFGRILQGAGYSALLRRLCYKVIWG